MFAKVRPGFFLFALIYCAGAHGAQQTNPPALPAPAPASGIVLDVVVRAKSGPPVGGLQQQDFTVLDNKTPRQLSSFQAIDGRQAPIDVIILVDDVNTGVEHVAYDRNQLDKFLKTDGGHLTHRAVIAFLTDQGLKIPNSEFSTDGNALSATMNDQHIGLHSINKDSGFYGATERFDISMKAFRQLVGAAVQRPGRKFMIWISPGWPVLSSINVQQQLDAKQHQQIFNDIVAMSALLRQGSVTLYSIDPLGVSDFDAQAFRWQDFVKGVSKPGQSEWGNMALQVLATQSGGMAFTVSNDVAGELQQCFSDGANYYEMSLAPPLDEKPSTYHHLEVRVNKPGLTARTRDGYYTHP